MVWGDWDDRGLELYGYISVSIMHTQYFKVGIETVCDGDWGQKSFPGQASKDSPFNVSILRVNDLKAMGPSPMKSMWQI